MLKAIKRKRREQALKKRLPELKRDRAFYNFESAKTVGILYLYQTKESFALVADLIRRLSAYKIDCRVIGYYNNDKALPKEYAPIEHEEDTPMPNNILFYNAALNWYGRPTVPEIDTFINQDFDILIDLSRSKDIYALRYIASLSKAKFKVGGTRYDDDPYDLVLLESTDNDKLFGEEVFQFLRTVKLAK